MVALMVWASQATGLPFPHSLPNVTFQSAIELCEAYADVCDENISILGAYDDFTDTIHLRRVWNTQNLAHTSTLLHELVHYMQDKADATYPCPQEREAEAYEAEIKWWKAMGLDYFDVLQRDRPYHMLITTCPIGH
jgi:hypothetical protein